MFMLQHISFCTCILASISIPLFYIYMTFCNPCGNYTSRKQFYVTLGLRQHDHMIPIGIWVYHLPLSKCSNYTWIMEVRYARLQPKAWFQPFWFDQFFFWRFKIIQNVLKWCFSGGAHITKPLCLLVCG